MADDHKISTTLATAVGLGAIIGAGIYVLSGTAIALAGANALLAFLLVGLVAVIIALEFGELGAIMPYAKGAAYSYVYKAFGSELGFITGIIQYFGYATTISVIALGFGSYLSGLLGVTTGPLALVCSIALIIVLALVNLFGIKNAIKTDFALVVIKVAVLLFFIGFALFFVFGQGHFAQSNFSVGPQQGTIAALFAASIAIFFAYSGFQVISTFAARVRGGGRSAAKSILAAVIISIVLYVLVVFSLLLLLPASQYSISAAPLLFALTSVSAPEWLIVLVSIGALVATTSATLAMVLSSSRMLYQISSDHLLPKIFRAYNKKRDVAVDGVLVSALIGIVMLFSGNIYIIAAISNFGILFSYLMASLALMHFRGKRTEPQFKMPLYPYLTVIAIVAILLFMAGMPQVALMVGVALIIGLIIVYYVLREAESKKIIRIKLFK